MKLVLMLVVRDEEDIIKANLDYHLAAGVDFVIIADHQCLDRTMDIVRDYERQGYASVQSKPEPGYYQGRWLTQMAKDALERHAADWVIPGDADEFWWVENDSTLKQALEQVPASVRALGAGRHNFVARSGQNGAGFLASMTFREVSSLNALGDKLPGKVCFRARSDVIVRQGSHDLIVAGEVVKPAVCGQSKGFPFSDPDQRSICGQGNSPWRSLFADRFARRWRSEAKAVRPLIETTGSKLISALKCCRMPT